MTRRPSWRRLSYKVQHYLMNPSKSKSQRAVCHELHSLMQLSFSGTFKTGASEQVCTITVTAIIPGVQNNHLLSGSEAVISSQTKVKTLKQKRIAYKMLIFPSCQQQLFGCLLRSEARSANYCCS